MGLIIGVLQILTIILLATVLAIPMGKYIAGVFSRKKSFLDLIFSPVEKAALAATGEMGKYGMDWKEYLAALLLMNAAMWVLAISGFIIMGMSPDLAFHTASSFTANTDQQHYSGELQMSSYGQMMVIFLMFSSSATGLASAFAFIRGFGTTGGKLGNYFEDMVRILVRILIPFSLLSAIIFAACGVPQVMGGELVMDTLAGGLQSIPIGPTAAMESIKFLGNNGGGYYNTNSAHPFENPSPLTNVVQLILTMLIPLSLPYAFGIIMGNKRQGYTLLAVILFIFISASVMLAVGTSDNPDLPSGITLPSGYIEGKEQRFTAFESVFFVATNTYVQSGGTTCSISSMMPMGVLGAMIGMMLGCVPGGIGIGLELLLAYSIVSVFIAGLMVGKIPEFMRKKIGTDEMKYVFLVIITFPIIVLISTASTILLMPSHDITLNDGTRGFSEILYEFLSASANNGSGMAGLQSSSPYFNILSGTLILIGRYVPISAFLGLAGLLSTKKTIEDTRGSFPTDTIIFAVLLICVLIMDSALSFLPVLAMGPLADLISTGVKI
ncbi:potassium-transporting ATPase subunit A [Methanocella sp. CWC-04]|uniref:Potassium-transporting ATPase subunit A n=1 Tax=Methanooceanicella nereidis TaxID=2052831 RepID=A0AAP2W8L8_9EURY|nr:potassium-transporting ATPase subunit KdpA [Methanocella sp. CWC-04]MCD1296156.1 potassium-transporting ATPase subunit A [Methanocella sp. CWC-04]